MKMPSKEGYMQYLKNEMYKQWTGSGYPSTIYQYASSVEKVMKQEGINTYLDLPDRIQELCKKYGPEGPRGLYGAQGHNTVINALRRFMEYLLNDCCWMPKTGIYYN